MTATLSVGQLKGGRPKQDQPRAGTKLRAAYDALRRGEQLPNHKHIIQLRDFYGMDIAHHRLVGEWEGPIYVPAERIICSAFQ